MDRDYFIELTVQVYRLTEGFKRDFLKFKLRILANQILADLILASNQNPGHNPTAKFSPTVQAAIELVETLEEARAEKLIPRQEFLLLKKEYGRILKQTSRVRAATHTANITSEAAAGNNASGSGPSISQLNHKRERLNLNERQIRILETLKQGRKVQVWQLQKIFSKVSKRTLRRDLDGLLANGIVERVGKWNEVFYQSKEVGLESGPIG